MSLSLFLAKKLSFGVCALAPAHPQPIKVNKPEKRIARKLDYLPRQKKKYFFQFENWRFFHFHFPLIKKITFFLSICLSVCLSLLSAPFCTLWASTDFSTLPLDDMRWNFPSVAVRRKVSRAPGFLADFGAQWKSEGKTSEGRFETWSMKRSLG